MEEILVLFGATGDLASKKILPALNQWYLDSEPYKIVVCLGRKAFSNEEYIDYIQTKGKFELKGKILENIIYINLDFKDYKDYIKLKNIFSKYDNMGRNFYLAVKPNLFEIVAENLSRMGIFEKNNLNHKLIFEKPFGENFESFKEIQKNITTIAEEAQIYRIDHYLGKEMIRNILILRFGNKLFETAWNKEAIASIKIINFETEGVEERIDYYDASGAIIDMIQSHLLQIMSLISMEKPINFNPENIRLKKIEILSKFKINDKKAIEIGQYKSYRTISKNLSNSNTETYAKIFLIVDSPFWEGVDFVIETGKKMREKKTQIEIKFKKNILFLDENKTLESEANKLVIKVYPREGVKVKFNSKSPGYGFEMETVESEYCHECRITGNRPEAYIKLLMDAKNGDRTLFVSPEEIEKQWEIADIIKQKSQCKELYIYEEGDLIC